MKMVKIFPAPHVEVRIHVSEKMEKDLRECRQMAELLGDGKVCDQCSWRDIGWLNANFCELLEVVDRILEGERDGGTDQDG